MRVAIDVVPSQITPLLLTELVLVYTDKPLKILEEDFDLIQGDGEDLLLLARQGILLKRVLDKCNLPN